MGYGFFGYTDVKKFEKTEMTTLVKCTNNLIAEGYTENFVANEKGLLAPKGKRIYKPAEIEINSYYRFEGESDPADNAILYAIETFDGVKGLLIDAYGTYSNPHISKFITEVMRIEKFAHEHDPPGRLARILKALLPSRFKQAKESEQQIEKKPVKKEVKEKENETVAA